jgi:hypothetical protein
VKFNPEIDVIHDAHKVISDINNSNSISGIFDDIGTGSILALTGKIV